jgi:hypothetical protein
MHEPEQAHTELYEEEEEDEDVDSETKEDDGAEAAPAKCVAVVWGCARTRIKLSQQSSGVRCGPPLSTALLSQRPASPNVPPLPTVIAYHHHERHAHTRAGGVHATE